MAVNAQEFLASIQKAAANKPKPVQKKKIIPVPDLSIFGIPGSGKQIEPTVNDKGREPESPQPVSFLPKGKAADGQVCPEKTVDGKADSTQVSTQANTQEPPYGLVEDAFDAGSDDPEEKNTSAAINRLIRNAVKAKKAADANKDIVERLRTSESQFTRVFMPLQEAPGFVSIADLSRTKAKTGQLRTAAYIRVSSDSSDQENSYETQERYFSNLLSQNPDWVNAGVYSDYGISGTSKAKRTGYKRLLRHCSEGKIDRIVCKSISRFARNTSDFMTALNLLHDHQVTIYFEKEGLDTADPVSDFILTTLAAIAQEESRSISTNIRWGNQKRYPKGQTRNYDIYGYRFAEGDDAMETFEDGYQIRRVEIVEEEAAIVRRIFNEVEEGESFAKIARQLNFEHVKSPDHGKAKRKRRGRTTAKEGIETGWTSGMISRMVRLERYCGDVLLQKSYTPDYLTHRSVKNNGSVPQFLVKDHHPAIISREQFERVQVILESNSIRFSSKTEPTPYPFSGRLICAHCGRAYSIRNAGSYPIWFCPTAALNNGKRVCHAEKVYEEQVVRMFRRAFTDRFRLLEAPVQDDVKAADIMSGRYGEEEEVTCSFDKKADGFVEQVRQRLLNIQKLDFMERDRAFLKRQIEALKVTISEAARRSRMLVTQKETMEVRRDLLHDDTIDPASIEKASARIADEEERIKKAESEKEQLEQRLSYLEAYWERLEEDHAERDRALEWLDTLPEGREGTVQFLNGLTSAYVKAFALSITIHDPLHYTVHWFDDTYTEVEMYSNVEGYQYTSAFYHKSRYRRKRR